MKKVATNQIEILNRVVNEETVTTSEWVRKIYITGGYEALYQLKKALETVIETSQNETKTEDLSDYQSNKTEIVLRLQDWE